MEQSSVCAPKKSRDLGIELFRVAAMFLIVLLHVLGRGGVYGGAEYLGTNYKIAWFLETAAYCSVNCYALISGFVGIHSRFRFRKIVYLWLEVAFITLSTTALFAIFAPHYVEADDWLKAAFPLIKREYWYFNAYALMFPFIPLLNKGLLSISRRQHLTTMGFLFVVTTILPILGDRDLFQLGGGYSCLWLMVLYVFGAYFKLYGIPKFAHPLLSLSVFLLTTTIAWAQKIGWIPFGNAGLLIGYTSPAMVIMAVSLLCFFAKINVRGKLLRFAVEHWGKATFGVFLVHVGAMSWKVIGGRWAHFGRLSPLRMILAVLAAAISMYVISSAYSSLRIWLFRICHVHQAVDKIADALCRKRSQ